jgi:hypothetical protein
MHHNRQRTRNFSIMSLLFAILLLGALAPAQESAAPTAAGKTATEQNSTAKPPAAAQGMQGDLLTPPRGKSTVMGGTISAVDPIADRLTLKVAGGRAIRILYDERTEVYRDGVKGNLRDLRANDHASVETMLDGTTVFARSIHMLSQSPEGEARGQILSYDPGTRQLTLNESLSREAIKLQVPPNATIVRQGQAASAPGAGGAADLVKGTLVSAKFKSNNSGAGVASEIAILAVPGSRLTFTGTISHLDLHARQLVVTDAQDDQSYKISFEPSAFPVAHDLHEGGRVKIIAEYNGTGYQARDITLQ